jgi:hypothetical protein
MDVKAIQRFLIKTHEKNKIASAYIVYGGEKKERDEISIFLSMLLNCKKCPPCGRCEVCLQIKKKVHPDTKWILPSKNILSIDDVRWVKEDIYLTPYSGERKIYIFDIEYMKEESANALLKILEEPPPYGILIIQSSSINFFLPTILSRCQKLRLNYGIPENEYREAQGEFMEMSMLLKKRRYYEFFKQVDAFVKDKEREEIDDWLSKIVISYRNAYFKKTGIIYDIPASGEEEGKMLVEKEDVFLDVIEKILELKEQVRYNINLKLGLDNLFLSID